MPSTIELLEDVKNSQLVNRTVKILYGRERCL